MEILNITVLVVKYNQNGYIVHTMTALLKAIEYFDGNQAALARAIDPELTSMSVSHWKKRGVPMRRAVQIERVTGGTVTKEQLCPEQFGIAS